MARLLACWELGSGLGHVARLASVSRALGKIGHTSSFAARDVVTAGVLKNSPFESLIQAPIYMRGSKDGSIYTFSDVYEYAGLGDKSALAQLIRAWLSVFTATKVQGIYGSFSPVSILAAYVGGLPAARIGTPFTCPQASNIRSSVLPWRKKPPSRNEEVVDEVIRSVCKDFRVPVLDGLKGLLSTAQPFLTSWPEMEIGHTRTDVDYYGPLDGLAPAASANWNSKNQLRILVYMPKNNPRNNALAEALASFGAEKIWIDPRAKQETITDDFQIVSSPLDIRKSLESASLFVTRGGHGTALESISAGCPMLILPDTLETERNAWALASRGLAVAITGNDLASNHRLISENILRLTQTDAPHRLAAQALKEKYKHYAPNRAAHLLAVNIARSLRIE